MFAAVRANPEVQLYGEPDVSVVAFGPKPGYVPRAHTVMPPHSPCVNSCSSKLSIYNLGDEMTARGWNLNILQVWARAQPAPHSPPLEG